MKKIFVLLISFILLLTGCTDTNQNIIVQEKENREEQYACLVNELGGYIATQNGILKDIPLSDITTEIEQMSYYKGIYTDENNMYVIVDGNNPSEQDYLDSFQKYFAKKYPLYQYEVMFDFYIYIHNELIDVNFDEIANKCRQNTLDEDDGKKLTSKTLKSLNKTDKIIIRDGKNSIGTITKPEVIEEILAGIAESRIYGTFFLCDGYGFELDMYENEKLIDTIYYWGDTRLIPKSVHSGCSYYSVSLKNLDLRKIIERETDFRFFTILCYTDLSKCDDSEKIYEDEKYEYYLMCAKSDEIMIKFEVSDLIMTLKYALENGYITPNKLEIYSDIFVKKEK